MKKRIFNLSLVLVLMISVIFTLTACSNNKDDDEKSSKKKGASAESAIENLADAINDQDVEKILELFDYESFGQLSGDKIKKKKFENILEDFFDEYSDFEIEIDDITPLEEDDDVVDELLEEFDSFDDFEDEFEERIEDETDLDEVEIYTVKITVPSEFKSNLPYKKKDVVFVSKIDGEYKVVYTAAMQSIYSDYKYDYGTIEKNKSKDDDKDSVDVDAFNANFKTYENKQSGKNVKKFIDAVITNNKSDTDDHIIYISTYDEEGTLDEIMLIAEDDLKEIKNDIKDNHNYKIEFDMDDDGFIRYADIKY